MANKNKNSKQLVPQSDNDPTLDLDRPDFFRNANRDIAPEIEVDAKTFDIDEFSAAATGRSNAEVRIALDTQTRLVEELSFDIEQLRARRRGLEEELKARTEIADSLNGEIKETRSQLGDAILALESRNEDISAAREALDESNLLVEQLKSRTSEFGVAASDFEKTIKTLEADLRSSALRVSKLEKQLHEKYESAEKSEPHDVDRDKIFSALEIELTTSRKNLADLRCYIDGRKDEWSLLRSELAAANEQLNVQQTETVQVRDEIEERNSQLVRSREQYIDTCKHLKQAKGKVRKLHAKNRGLEQALNHDARREIAACRAQIAEQSGELATHAHELRGMRKDNDRNERYSDSLRIQLQNQVSIAKAAVNMRSKFEAGLDSANVMIADLAERLEAEQLRNAQHTESHENLKNEFDREVRLIRFELGTAEQTLADQQTANEQLASDLIDNQGYRQELESQLGDVHDECTQSVQELTAKLDLARQEADDHERKLHIKNNAIADLMRELSKFTSNIELRGDVDNALQKIDGFRTDKDEIRSSNSRDRVARLLVGNADGRELRFPLFKNRLTIGRTSHNDIQLNMQYISRRHAVISTDQGKTRVIDWGSKNGVFVNDIQVTEQILQPGDIVSIGTTDFRYEERAKR
jgi:chromosome segregation ATPase